MNDMAIGGFIDREFAVDELTEQINIVPNMYGLVTQLGIFPPPRPLSTTYFGIERQNWSLNLLPITERGGPGTRGTVGKRDRKIFEVPQITARRRPSSSPICTTKSCSRWRRNTF